MKQPHIPIVLEEGGEPLTADSSLSLEEPDKLVDVTTHAGEWEGENDSHARQVACVRNHVTDSKKDI